MTSAPETRGPVAAAMAREHRRIAGRVDAASECLLSPMGAVDGLARAVEAAEAVRRHLATEERLLFGRPVLLEPAHAEHHLERDHGLIVSILSLIDHLPGGSHSTVPSDRRPLRVLAALRRLHHLLEHHDLREVEGMCVALDVALPANEAATLADELSRGADDFGGAATGRGPTSDDVHEPAILLQSAAPGFYADALWCAAVEGTPLALPPLHFPSAARRRAVEVAHSALGPLLDAAHGRVTLAAFDQALRVDRLLSRERS